MDDIPFLRRGSELSQPTPLRSFSKLNTPRRSRHASPAADLGGIMGVPDGDAFIGDSLEAPDGINVEVPPPPPP
eukprot:14897907-Heterocapsa_arctica.AAC.1